MNRFIKRCFSALSITAIGTMLSAGVVSAGSQPGDQGRPHKDRPATQLSQQAKNSNDTAQDSAADAHSRQVNTNLPFSLLSVGDVEHHKDHKDHKDPRGPKEYKNHKDPTGHQDHHDGVDQSNAAHNVAKSGNDNVTFQGIGQVAAQDVDGKHGDASGDIDQDAKNNNSTQQSSAASASSEQKNKNAPVSVLTIGSNNGDVDQSNAANDVALSNNGNYTDQSIFQAADQAVDGTHGKDGNDGHPGKGQHPGKDDHTSNDGHPGKGDGTSGDIDQEATNNNGTEQRSAAQASSEQKNVNLPISILSVGSNNGDVDQSNRAHNVAKSGNDNATGQVIVQAAEQDADGGGTHGSKDDHKGKDGHPGTGGGAGGDIDQDATNHNSTGQESSAEASSQQTNVNLPISILSVGSNNGDVDQSNSAHNTAVSGNSNETEQGIGQVAAQEVDGGSSHGKSDGGKSDGGDAEVDQEAENDNSTSQASSATASSHQLNVNAPISILSIGANNGDVDQSNHANNSAGSFNDNGTGQWIGQLTDQLAG